MTKFCPTPVVGTEAVLLSLDAVRAADGTGAAGAVMELLAVLSAAGVRRPVLHAVGQSGAQGGETEADVVDRALARLLDELAGSYARSWYKNRAAVRDLVEQVTALHSASAACRDDPTVAPLLIRLRWTITTRC